MSVTLEELIQRAGVDHGFVRRLHELGAFRSDDDRYEERDVHVAALLNMWERAGLSIPSILAAVDARRLSLDFLDSPAWELPEPLPITYREFAKEQGIPFELLQGIQVAMGFAAPDPDDRVARDDARLAELARIVLDIGASEDSVRRLFAGTRSAAHAHRGPGRAGRLPRRRRLRAHGQHRLSDRGRGRGG